MSEGVSEGDRESSLLPFSQSFIILTGNARRCYVLPRAQTVPTRGGMSYYITAKYWRIWRRGGPFSLSVLPLSLLSFYLFVYERVPLLSGPAAPPPPPTTTALLNVPSWPLCNSTRGGSDCSCGGSKVFMTD